MEELIKSFTSQNENNANSGYTLIEVLVGLTIITLIFSFGFVGFREFARRQTLNGAVRSLTGELRLAQEQALAGNKPNNSNCNNPNTLNGYNFRVNSTTTYQTEASCSGGVVTVKEKELPTGVTISAPSPNPILFKVLGQGTNIPSGDATITLTLTVTGDTREITVSSTGEIQ